MVRNDFYKCEICDCHIRLRYQCGYFDIPVSIYCPHCNTHIFGKINLTQEPYGIKLTNAIKQNPFDDGYVIELASEFVTKKYQDNTNSSIISPFMRSNPFDENRTKRRGSVMIIAQNLDGYKKRIENIFNLLRGNNIELLKKFLNKSVEKDTEAVFEQFDYKVIKNSLDAVMATKYCIMPFLLNTIAPNLKTEFNNIVSKMVDIIKNNTGSLIDYVNFLDTHKYFDVYYHRIPKYIIHYLEKISQLIPVYDVHPILSEIDQTSLGVTTISIDDMHDLYSKGYELLCDSIDVLFGLDNINKYGVYNDFGAGAEDFMAKMNSYRSKFKKYEQLSNLTPMFTVGIANILNNIIRNSDAHYSMEMDGLSQKVIFMDKHQQRTRCHELSFLDFGAACVDIYSAILLVWEYYYQLLKIKYTTIEKMSLNFAKTLKGSV